MFLEFTCSVPGCHAVPEYAAYKVVIGVGPLDCPSNALLGGLLALAVHAVLTFTHHQQKDLHQRLGFGVPVEAIIRITISIEPQTCSIREQTKAELEQIGTSVAPSPPKNVWPPVAISEGPNPRIHIGTQASVTQLLDERLMISGRRRAESDATQGSA